MAKKSAAHKSDKGSSSKQHHAQKPGRDESFDNQSSHREKIREKKVAKGKKTKKGCFPKLLMLILPFMAVGAYFLIRS